MSMPYHYVNVMTGSKSCRVIEDGKEIAELIKKAGKPLLVLGERSLSLSLDGKAIIDYGAAIAKAKNIPICATAHTKKKLLELGLTPKSSYDIAEIVNHLKDPNWKGVKGEGNHDLVIFLGIRSDIATQGLSTLKHFAQHLKTMTLCKYLYPHASYSLPNLKDSKWKEILECIIENLK